MNNCGRKVEYTYYGHETEKGIGTFHQWGVDYEEFETGTGPFTAAVIEKEDGNVILVHAEAVRFIKDGEQP